MIFRFHADNLTLMRSIESGIVGRNAVDFVAYNGNHILWVEIMQIKYDLAVTQVHDYDTETTDLKELVDQRVGLQELDVTDIQRLEDKFYYTGKYGKIMSLSVNI